MSRFRLCSGGHVVDQGTFYRCQKRVSKPYGDDDWVEDNCRAGTIPLTDDEETIYRLEGDAALFDYIHDKGNGKERWAREHAALVDPVTLEPYAWGDPRRGV